MSAAGPVVSSGVDAVRIALQRLLVVAAAVALLGHGGVELAPRLVSAGASATAASGVAPAVHRPAASRPGAESKPVQGAFVLRLGLAGSVPTAGTDAAAGPGSSPRVAPHLVARPVARPASSSHVRGVGGGASGRAPPAPAGT